MFMVSNDYSVSTSHSSNLTPARRRRLLPKLLFSGVVAVFGVGFCELALRLLAPQPPSWLDVYRRHPALALYTLQPNVERLVDTGESRWTVRTDADGFRASKQLYSRGPIVLCLGDSFMFGHGVEHDQSVVGLLQSSAETTTRYINASVPGYGPIQYKQVLEYLIGTGIRPRRLLIGTYVGNDFHDCAWQKDAQVKNGVLGNRGDLRSAIKMNSHLYRLLSKGYHHFVRGQDEAFQFQDAMEIAKNWEDGLLKKATSAYRENFQQIATICRDHSIELVVLGIPHRKAVETRNAMKTPDRDPDLPMHHAEKIFADLSISFVDLTGALAQHEAADVYLRHDGHLTPLGHRVIAEFLVERFPHPSAQIP
ncbi:MAG: hypothetical protein AABZ47_07220 [Planctomycetota bacterium]|mgnify:CR=1 FL=1